MNIDDLKLTDKEYERLGVYPSMMAREVANAQLAKALWGITEGWESSAMEVKDFMADLRGLLAAAGVPNPKQEEVDAAPDQKPPETEFSARA